MKLLPTDLIAAAAAWRGRCAAIAAATAPGLAKLGDEATARNDHMPNTPVLTVYLSIVGPPLVTSCEYIQTVQGCAVEASPN